MNILDAHKKFRRYCLFEEQLRQSTVKASKASIRTFMKRTGVENVKEMTLDVLREFFYEGMERHQWSFWCFMNYYKYLKKFLDWCIKEGYIKVNPILEIKKPKKPQTLPRRLTYEEAQRVLQVTLNYDWRYEFEHSRNYAIVAILFYGGLRCREILNLQMIDVNINVGNILIRSGKGNKDRNVPIHSKLRYILKHYIQDRKRLGKTSEYFFTGVQSDLPLNYKAISRICKKVSIESGIKFTPHQCRHTFGSVAVEQGMGLVQLKEIMGHSDISSTMIYMKMSSKSLKEGLDKIELF
ncbi:tyrosine-type recombinase/integrase [Patescibacteria group bacterium]